MHNYNLSNRQNGLSLIELMIALVLGIIVIFGVTQSLIAMSVSSRVQSRNAELLETADSALSYISFRMRNALSTPCERYVEIEDALTIHGLAGTVNVQGSPTDEIITATQNTQISNLIRGLGISVASNNVTRNFGNGASNFLTDDITLVSIGDRKMTDGDVLYNTTSVTVDGTFVSPRVGNETLYAITDCEKMDVFRAARTVASGVTTLNFMKPGDPTGTNIRAAYRTADLSIVSPLDVTQISVNDSGQLTDRTIFKTSGGALMDNVELIRVLFGVDNGTDGIVDQYISAAQLASMPNSTVMSADIYMLVRVPSADPAFSANYNIELPRTDTAISGALPAMDNINVTDKVQRKVFMRSVVFRNNAITL